MRRGKTRTLAVMFAPRIVLFVLGASTYSIASADAAYRLTRCTQFKDGVALGFVGKRGEVRRMSLRPQAVELSGDVKGSARLSQVKELVLHPVLRITYTSGAVVRFG